ncbi:MAG: tyrosine-type recombinase/integrase [Eubacteriales bacterium]|nr:tyrosine-type recombinase/integrase [Eubacteriales bacterium]
MNKTLNSIIEEYLKYGKNQKRLDDKTLKAYRIDLRQFCNFFQNSNINSISMSDMEAYIGHLNQNYKPKTAKRKVASLKALFHYLEYKSIIENNPFNKIKTKFREPLLLPKTIPLYTIETLLSMIYKENSSATSVYKRKRTLLDIAIAETLFSTGMRISELCNLKHSDIDLYDATIRIYGKGSKERIIQIGNEDVIKLLKKYENAFLSEIQKSGYFFTNTNSLPLSDQAVRRMINKYCKLAAIDLHITPHMFRHTFATCLLEADVDIRYIQEMLGHSSITVTEIYTHVALSKQKDILTTKHPRKNFKF